MALKTWIVTIAAVSTGFTLGACRADDVVKQGIEGEYCNDRDEDCREGLLCEAGVCKATDAPGSVTCGEVCNHLESCETGEANCEANCRATLDGTCEGLACPWSTDAADAFGTCILEMSCEEALASDATQVCYRELPIDEDRQNRCDAFIAAAQRCDSAVSVNDLRNACFLLGRTNTAESFARTDACVDRVADGLCPEIEDCFNSVFELDPPLELGDGQTNIPG